MSCSVPDCGKPVKARGMCAKHYMRNYRAGSCHREEKSIPRHGTNAAYQRHVRLKEKPCEPCAKWRREYQKEWRLRNPAAAVRYAPLNNSRRRAYVRLAEEYPERFREIWDEERAR
jgi:hypothetical protein